MPVWLVGGVGRLLPARMWEALAARLDDDMPWDADDEVVPSELFDMLVGPAGPEPLADGLRRVDCPIAPELFRRDLIDRSVASPLMPSRRDLIKMTPDEVDAFLHGPRTMNVATIGRDGTPHLVAMWYGFLGDAPAFWTFGKSQKVMNLERDPRITASSRRVTSTRSCAASSWWAGARSSSTPTTSSRSD